MVSAHWLLRIIIRILREVIKTVNKISDFRKNFFKKEFVKTKFFLKFELLLNSDNPPKVLMIVLCTAKASETREQRKDGAIHKSVECSFYFFLFNNKVQFILHIKYTLHKFGKLHEIFLTVPFRIQIIRLN